MALVYSYRQLVQRIWRHLNKDFPGTDFSISEREMLLYINESMSYGLVGQVYNGAKILGTLEMPEAYILQFQLPALVQDSPTRYWTSTLPQPPVSLPLGYSISRGYFADSLNGMGTEIVWIKAKRVSRRMNMPMQFGVRGWVTGSKIWLAASNGTSLLNQNVYIEMPSTRATNLDSPMNLPDDATKLLMDMVMIRMKERLGLPMDTVQNDLPAGNKTS
jgi:hypothetical protein